MVIGETNRIRVDNLTNISNNLFFVAFTSFLAIEIIFLHIFDGNHKFSKASSLCYASEWF